VHVLLNNAGIMAVPLSRDARGFESQLATNHLGHFQLRRGCGRRSSPRDARAS